MKGSRIVLSPPASVGAMQPSRSLARRSLARVSAISVGIVANPASGRDIRRLVAGASVFGNADKAGMVYRLLCGLGATGVEQALMMPAADGLTTALEAQLRARGGAGPEGAAALPELEQVRMTLTAS